MIVVIVRDYEGTLTSNCSVGIGNCREREVLHFLPTKLCLDHSLEAVKFQGSDLNIAWLEENVLSYETD